MGENIGRCGPEQALWSTMPMDPALPSIEPLLKNLQNLHPLNYLHPLLPFQHLHPLHPFQNLFPVSSICIHAIHLNICIHSNTSINSSTSIRIK